MAELRDMMCEKVNHPSSFRPPTSLSHLPSSLSHLNDIRQYLRGRCQLEHPTDLQKKEKIERNEILAEAIQYGIPLRQLSRLTGISYGVTQRIIDKMKA